MENAIIPAAPLVVQLAKCLPITPIAISYGVTKVAESGCNAWVQTNRTNNEAKVTMHRMTEENETIRHAKEQRYKSSVKRTIKQPNGQKIIEETSFECENSRDMVDASFGFFDRYHPDNQISASARSTERSHDEKNAHRKTSSSSSSSSSSSDDSDDNNKPKRNDDNNKRDDDDWDDNHTSDEEEAEAWNISIESLNLIRLSRSKMESWCHAPFFKDTVTGCFVRINVGIDPKHKKPAYRVAQISDVVETTKIYDLGKTRTNIGIKLKHARQHERVYRLASLSNTEFEPNEFNEWFENMTNDRCELPSKDFVERKIRDILNAVN